MVSVLLCRQLTGDDRLSAAESGLSHHVVAAALWLLTFFFARELKWTRVVLLIVAWMILMGGPPINDRADLVFGLVQQALMVGVNLWAIRFRGSAPNRAQPVAV